MLRRLDGRVFVIGVAHVLPKSAAEVREVILRERPAIVALELCLVRYSALMRRAEQRGAPEIAHPKQPRLPLLGSLLHRLQDRFAQQTGMLAGGEMMAAIRHAEEVGARIELIDRGIDVTLRRLVERTGNIEKLRLFAGLLLGFLPLARGLQLESVTDEEVVNHLLRELKRTFPVTYDVLVEERDAWMAERIVALLTSTDAKIACVVGAGHVPGLSRRIAAFLSGSVTKAA